MKKVLILAYDFPPYVSVGGLRPYSWYEYFNDFGIHPVVVTRQWANNYGNHLDYIAPSNSHQTIVEENSKGTIIKTPYKANLANRIMLKYGASKFRFIRKLISAYYEFAQWLWLTGPKSQLFFAAKEYLKSNQVDAIIATGDPFILFHYASLLSEKFNIPWIADYRDPWIQDKSRKKNKLLQTWDAYFERKCSQNLAEVITVSEFLETQISTQLKTQKFHIIPNGYNPKAVEIEQNNPQKSDTLSIAFVGTVYNWHPIESFLSTCNRFVANGENDLRLNFYGVSASDWVQELVQQQYTNLIGKVNVVPRMPNEELLVALTGNNLFLLFNDYSFLGTKIFDYVALKRKIIFCYKKDTEAQELKKKYYKIQELRTASQQLQEDMLNETNAGCIINDANHLQEVLRELHKEFVTNGYITCNSVNTERYSRKVQVEQLAEVIKNTCKTNID